MKRTLTNAEITQVFLQGRHCSQCVLGQFSDLTGYDRDETDRIAACFGGGMYMGETCGAVTGGLMAIGLLCEDPDRAKELAGRFTSAFRARFGSTMCRELIGYDFSDPEQAKAARASGKLTEYCPTVVNGAIEILEELLEN